MAGFLLYFRLDIKKIRWTTSKTNDQIMGGLKKPPFCRRMAKMDNNRLKIS